MPKKTRKEKILAERRRRMPHYTNVPLGQSSGETAKTQSGQYQFQIQTPRRTALTNPDNLAELATVRHDIVKTVVLAAIAIGVEIGLTMLLNSK